MRTTTLLACAMAVVVAGTIAWVAAGARDAAPPRRGDDSVVESARLPADVARLTEEVAELRSDVARQATELARLREAVASAPKTAPSSQPPSANVSTDQPSIGTNTGQAKAALARLKSVTDGRRFVAIEDARTDLIRMGDDAVPEVLALLDSGFEQDLGGRFETRGHHVDAYPGVRMVLLDVLRQIGTSASKKAFAEALGRSERIDDLWALKLYWGEKDPAFVDAVAEVAPRLVRLVAKVGLSTAVGDRPDSAVQNLLLWLYTHPTPGLAGPLEEIVLAGRPAGTCNERVFELAFNLLVRLAPEKAAEDALALQARAPDKRELLELTGKLYCTNAIRARYFATLFARGDFAPPVRIELYQRMPADLWSQQDWNGEAMSREAQVDDARPYVDFLDRRIQAETDSNAKRVLETALGRLRAQVAANPK